MNNDEITKSKIFTRRAFMLTAGKFSLFSLLAGRLFYLQLLKSAEYKTLSDNNSIKLMLIPPIRGRILDAENNPLAINKTHYRLMFDHSEGGKDLGQINKLAQLITISDDEQQNLLDKIHKFNKKQPLILLEHLTWQEVARIEINAVDLPGLYIETAYSRYYPYGVITAHLIGYLGAITEEAIANNHMLSSINLKMGKAGIEKSFDQDLIGAMGIKRMEVNAYGVTIRELSREEPKPGQDLKLTLDIRLQQLTTEKLGDRDGAAVIINIETGAILASVSTPSFDSNNFINGLTSEDWQSLVNNPHSPMINKTIAAQYPPGSIFKLIVALSGLMEGINPEHKINCIGFIQIGNRKFHCWKKEGHGFVNLVEAIGCSCNCYFYTMAKKIGIDSIFNMAKQFGLGQKHDLELPGELSGILPSQIWKFTKYKKEWLVGDTINSSIGQGYMLTTILQLAVLSARIASGKKIEPHLIAGEKHNFSNLFIPDAHFKLVRKGMLNVLNSSMGSAYGKGILDEKYAMAGKTGTVQVISKKFAQQDFSKDGTKWEHKNHAIFTGFAPFDQPKYACAVIIEHGGGGSAAAPVARDILLAAQLK